MPSRDRITAGQSGEAQRYRHKRRAKHHGGGRDNDRNDACPSEDFGLLQRDPAHDQGQTESTHKQNSLHSARHKLPQLACALLFNSGAIQSHIFAKRKPQIDQTKNLSAATIQKGRTRTRHHPFDRFIWLIIHLVDSARSFTDARMDLGTAQTIGR